MSRRHEGGRGSVFVKFLLGFWEILIGATDFADAGV